MLDEIRFWAQVIGDAERTVVCSPEMESRIKGWIDARDLRALITVWVNPACPDDRIYVIDMHALEATMRQSAARTAFRIWP